VALLKVLLMVIVAICLFSIAGVTGILFVIWPTQIGDHALHVSVDTIAQLERFKEEAKFVPDLTRYYPGAPNEAVRLEAEQRMNLLIEDLICNLPLNAHKSFVLRSFKATLPHYDKFDSEERDQVAFYLERIMVITGADGSGELLNVWRYGFPYGKLGER
jgi:hypothetical protein